jgi:hypothetical protein
MKGKMEIVIFLVSMLAILSSVSASFAQMQTQDTTQDCETCPMKVGADALDHLKVYDGNDTRHYVECMGCALKLLRTCDTLHIETYCDWYGPDYKITADISGQGAVTNVNPSNALLLIGGGCTGNRVAYNQTAADALLANGFSQYTMMMMQQSLPANTNMTSISARALTFAATATPEEALQSPLVLVLLAAVGIAVITGSLIAYKKLKR